MLINAERIRHLSAVLLIGLFAAELTGCIPMAIFNKAMNMKNDGRTKPIPLDEELATIKGLTVYETVDKESFSGAIASFNGGNNTVPYGD